MHLSDHRGFRRGEFENWESEFLQMGAGVLGSKLAAPQRFRNFQRIFETALRRLKLAAIPRQSLSLKSCSPPNSFDVTTPPEPMCLLPLESMVAKATLPSCFDSQVDSVV